MKKQVAQKVIDAMANGASPSHLSGHLRLVSWRILIAGLCAIIASTIIHIIPEINSLHPGIVWYPVPTLLASVAVAYWIEVSLRANRSSRCRYSVKLWIGTAGLICTGSFFGLLLTGWQHILDGTARLYGESIFPEGPFRTSYPFIMGVAAGCVEEATIRGVFQLNVKSAIGDFYSQFFSLLIFVGIHGAAAEDINRLVFLIILAVFSGILASKTMSVVPSVVFHGAVNLLLSTVVFFLRPK